MIKPTRDNVLILLDTDKPGVTASGIALVHLDAKSRAYAHRRGTVLAVGPGYYRSRVVAPAGQGRDAATVEMGVLVEPGVHAGERVIVRATAGDNYSYAKNQALADMFGLEGEAWELRMVRSDEILAVIEGDAEVREGSAAAE